MSLTNKKQFQNAFKHRCTALFSKSLSETTSADKYEALSSLVREALNENWLNTNEHYLNVGARQVYYFSLEFLMGKFLEKNLRYLGAEKSCRAALAELDIDLDDLIACEADAGLGNGGLGRLAACFLDSLASMSLPGHGCGIRYKYGLFRQQIVDGYQVELPDNWLRLANPWEIRKPERSVLVKMGGNVRSEYTENGLRFVHDDYIPVIAVPYDMPIMGYENHSVNTLRLWSAEPPTSELFDFKSFSRGDYMHAISHRYEIEAISEVLYPDDSNYSNRLLRLKQQYFFVSAGIQSIVRNFRRKHENILQLPEYVCIHINDTHPALAVPELMRILMDDEELGWDEAWDITTRVIAYTNHTIMPEALEKWPVELFQNLLPRVYMIVGEIDRRLREQLNERYPGDNGKIEYMSILSGGVVKMANLAVVGSFSVNGVAEVHSELLKNVVLKDLYDFFPEKFGNKTNGITHRRWLIHANHGLTDVITDTIGDKWKKNPIELEKLTKFKDDSALHHRLFENKRACKIKLSKIVEQQCDVLLDPDSIFDVQVKRIHAYKRQLLSALHVQYLYNRIVADPSLDIVPRSFIFAGKAAPSYHFAKHVIKYINDLAKLVNNDPRVNGKIKVAFLENYNVGLAEKIFPASDVSEQISTASKEASGTGNMKFMLNGAVTIGTDDGANIEIRKLVGDDNFILFGLEVDEVLHLYKHGGYSAREVYGKNPHIKKVIDQLTTGDIFPYTPHENLDPIVRQLLDYNDEYFVLKDFDSYRAAHEKIDCLYRQTGVWASMSLMNIAMAGNFSSDITISRYASDIWRLKKCLPAKVR